jgi:hypothetical protein
MTATTNGHAGAKRFSLLNGKHIRVLPIPKTRGGGHLVLSPKDGRALLSFLGVDSPKFFLDCVAGFRGPDAPNIEAMRGGRLLLGSGLELEFESTADGQTLEHLEEELNRLLKATPTKPLADDEGAQSTLLETFGETDALLNDIKDMTVTIPMDRPGILHEMLETLFQSKVVVVALESESFTNHRGSLSAKVKARLELPRGLELKSLEAQIKAKDSTWRVSFADLPAGKRPRRDIRDLP